MKLAYLKNKPFPNERYLIVQERTVADSGKPPQCAAPASWPFEDGYYVLEETLAGRYADPDLSITVDLHAGTVRGVGAARTPITLHPDTVVLLKMFSDALRTPDPVFLTDRDTPRGPSLDLRRLGNAASVVLGPHHTIAGMVCHPDRPEGVGRYLVGCSLNDATYMLTHDGKVRPLHSAPTWATDAGATSAFKALHAQLYTVEEPVRALFREVAALLNYPISGDKAVGELGTLAIAGHCLLLTEHADLDEAPYTIHEGCSARDVLTNVAAAAALCERWQWAAAIYQCLVE